MTALSCAKSNDCSQKLFCSRLGARSKKMDKEIEYYCGSWQNDMMHGFGILHHVRSRREAHPQMTNTTPKFFGDFKEGKREGSFFVQEEKFCHFVMFRDDKEHGTSLRIDLSSSNGKLSICTHDTDKKVSLFEHIHVNSCTVC